MDESRRYWMRCPECGRVFDLTRDEEASEWHYGHDCEEGGDE